MNDRLRPMCIPPDATVRDAMLAIDRGEQIAFVIEDDDRLVGLLTDGDIRRAMLSGHDLDGPVMPHVSRSPWTVSNRAGRADVLDLMRARGVSQVPVVDPEGRLVGLHRLREFLGTAERENWAVIMAGGRGRRLGSITNEVPKPMVPVAGRPILERMVLHLVGFGIRRIVLSVHYLAEVIEDHFGDGSNFGCRIDYLREEEPLGTAGSLGLLNDLPETLPDAPLLVMNGDVVSQFSVADLLQHHGSTASAGTIAAHQHLYRVPYGVLEVDEDGWVERITEKPSASWLVSAGIYVLEPAIVQRIQPEPVDMTDVILDCAARGERIGIWHVDGEWIDVGHPAELRTARGH